MFGAVCNVFINLKDIKDEDFCTDMKKKADEEMKVAEKMCKVVQDALNGRKN